MKSSKCLSFGIVEFCVSVCNAGYYKSYKVLVQCFRFSVFLNLSIFLKLCNCAIKEIYTSAKNLIY